MSDNILVKDATGATKTMRTVNDGTAHIPVHRIQGYDTQDDMIKVKSVQKKLRDSFVGSVVDSEKWTTFTGAGGSISTTGGTLVLVSGTTSGSQTGLLSVDTFTVPFRVSAHVQLSQRIANQTFVIEAVSVDPVTLLPNDENVIAWLFDGTSATQAKYRVRNGGSVDLDSSASTVQTTASPGSIFELEPFADEAWFHSGVMDSNAGRSNSYRRHQRIPDPNATYKLRIRWSNAGVPASSSTATMQFISCQDYAELTAEITAGRGQVVAGQAVGVAVVSMPTTNVTLLNTPAVYADTTANLVANATFTGTSRDAGSTIQYSAFATNAISPTAGTLQIQMSSDNTNWYVAEQSTITANVPATIRAVVTARYYRVVFINGAVAQTGSTFAIFSAYHRVL